MKTSNKDEVQVLEKDDIGINVQDNAAYDDENKEYRIIKFELKKQPKQKEAIKLLSEKAQIFLYGGRRSGKTLIILYSIFVRAMKYPGSRHLVARLRFAHAKTSIWHESIPILLNKLPKNYYRLNKSDFYIKFWNGSEIWVGGFDDKKRVDKILGHEYASIYFNEVSQIPYKTVTVGLSSLAQEIEGLINRAYFDCNPPSPMHWCHKIFIEGIDPVTEEPLMFPYLYGSLLMNPIDNLENLPKNYIEHFLDILPKRERDRLRDGLFVKPEGMIYEEFDMSMVITKEELPEMEYYFAGTDFGLNMASVLMGVRGNLLFLIKDHGAFNTTAATFNRELKEEGWPSGNRFYNYCAHDAGERMQSINGGILANVSVEDGINFIKTKMENKEFFVCKDCRGWLAEVWDYKRDEKGNIIKQNDHFMDAGRYGAFSFTIPAKLSKKKSKTKPITAGMKKERF